MATAKVLGEWSPLARVYSPLQAGSIDGTDTEPHDQAVLRALRSSYKPNHLVQGNPRATIFVARLHPNTTDDTLQKTFSRYGHILKTRLVRDVVTGFSKGYAFVEYESEDDACYAFRQGQSLDIDGAQIFVDYEIERTLKGWIPRRLGGGFGGKKESGQLRFGGRDRPFRKPIVVSREMTDTTDRGFLKLREAGDETDKRSKERMRDDGYQREYSSHSGGKRDDRDRYRDEKYHDRRRHRPDAEDGGATRDKRDHHRHRDRSRDRRRSRSR